MTAISRYSSCNRRSSTPQVNAPCASPLQGEVNTQLCCVGLSRFKQAAQATTHNTSSCGALKFFDHEFRHGTAETIALGAPTTCRANQAGAIVSTRGFVFRSRDSHSFLFRFSPCRSFRGHVRTAEQDFIGGLTIFFSFIFVCNMRFSDNYSAL